MNDYSHPKYKNLYEEILIDYHYSFGKFNPIPYPTFTELRHYEQQRNQKIGRQGYQFVGTN